MNGDYSFKIQSILEGYNGMNFFVNLPENTNKIKIEVTFLKVIGNTLSLRLSEDGILTDVGVPENNSSQKISLEKIVNTNNIQIVFIFRENNMLTYIDDLKVTIQ